MDTLACPHKIFIFDDNPVDRKMCRRFLTSAAPEGTYRCMEHGTLEGSIEKVRGEKPDCILLDYRLKDGTGMDFLRSLQAGADRVEAAVVLVTGAGSEAVAVESFKSGVHDYLIKDGLTPEALHCAVSNAIKAVRTREGVEGRWRDMERRLSEGEGDEHFLARLSHQLRTPLTSVMIGAGLLIEQYGHHDDIRGIAGLILRNAEQQARMLDVMLETVVKEVENSLLP